MMFKTLQTKVNFFLKRVINGPRTRLTFQSTFLITAKLYRYI